MHKTYDYNYTFISGHTKFTLKITEPIVYELLEWLFPTYIL